MTARDVTRVVGPPSVSAVTETKPCRGDGLGVELSVLEAKPVTVGSVSLSKRPPVLYVRKEMRVLSCTASP